MDQLDDVTDLSLLSIAWLKAKEIETAAIADRRRVEDRFRKVANVRDDVEAIETMKVPGYKVKITSRFERKVDSDKLQDLANEHGLMLYLSSLFRWKAELNMSAWKGADETVTRPLMGAITTKPGRPSFSIEQE